MMFTVAVYGGNGRIGQVVCDTIVKTPDFSLAAAVGRDTNPEVRERAAAADIAVDVTRPDSCWELVCAAVRRGQRVITGTSGWSAQKLRELELFLQGIPGGRVVVVPNFSLGSVLGTHLAGVAAPFFKQVEIVETHHPGKLDSPSGTAIRTAEHVSTLLAGRFSAESVRNRQNCSSGNTEPAGLPEGAAETLRSGLESSDGSWQVARGQLVAGVPVHSLRLAGTAAKQEVRFGGQGETLTITHDTHTSDSYRAGIAAALKLVTLGEGLTVGLEALLLNKDCGNAQSMGSLNQ